MNIRWLGTAGHVVETASTTVLLDPFLTRPGLLRTALAPLEPTPEQWSQWLPDKVDAVILGHSHYDHLMDAPIIARMKNARILGSESTAAYARAAGVSPDKIDVVGPEGRTITVGDIEVRFVPSLHGRIFANRVPFPGEVHGEAKIPARLWDYRMGGAFGVHLTTPHASLYHNGSADLIDAQLAGLTADVLLVGLAGRKGTKSYLQRLAGTLAPRLVVPTHHDSFFAPMELGERLLPGIDLPGFLDEISRVAPGARVITPYYSDVIGMTGGRGVEAACVTPW